MRDDNPRLPMYRTGTALNIICRHRFDQGNVSMDFSRSAFHHANEKSFDFTLTTDCDAGYDPAPKSPPIGPGDWNPNPRKLKPLGALPPGWDILSVPGIYRFEIQAPQNEAFPLIYIGKAKSLRTRTRQYVEMVRRLIALHAGHEVVVDKDPLRYVHFALAQALIEGVPIRFAYFELPNTTSDQVLAREELLEISMAAVKYLQNGVFDYQFLNNLDAFARSAHIQLAPEWKRVQDLLNRNSGKSAG